MKSHVVEIHDKPNDFITIVGRTNVKVSARKIEALIEFSKGSYGENIFNEALEDGRLIKVITNTNKIRSLILMENNKVYPSTFSVSTLDNRIYLATHFVKSKEDLNYEE